ncbi:hypothetical protein [Spiroplasma citri]|nr:hypothetical protein [Spiroplasma citri]
MTVKKGSLFENIKNSINSVDKSFQPKNNLVNDNIMTVKKGSLFENIKK